MKKDLEMRTKKFALCVIELATILPRTIAAEVIARQLLRSATSVGANDREANRGVSRADFVSKMGIVQKEAAETQYWLEILVESQLSKSDLALSALDEATQLLAIFTTIGKRLKE